MAIYNLFKSHSALNDQLIEITNSKTSLKNTIRIKELNNKIDFAEFQKDDGLFWASATPDTFSDIVGSKFQLNDQRTFKISWVKPLMNENDIGITAIFNTFTAILLVRRIS